MQPPGSQPDEPTQQALEPPAPLRLAETALFLDLDGTLAPIAPRPEDVRPEAGRTRLLSALSRALDGRLAVISGRTLADVDRIVDGAVAVAAGVHGLERRTADGRVWRAKPSNAMAEARAAFTPIERAWPGVHVEDKGLSVAVHYRAAPDAYAEVRRVAESIAGADGLVLQWGDMVAELKTAGADKGDALRAFMVEPDFKGARPVFVGDDLTDEHGFAAASEGGGFGVLVGQLRATAARARLPDVAAVYAWLARSVPLEEAG
jgi:trehalose 6-phosphate phosphatase